MCVYVPMLDSDVGSYGCSMQLAIDVQLPKSCAGVAGKAIYIGGPLISLPLTPRQFCS
jgi:hypothetical protein